MKVQKHTVLLLLALITLTSVSCKRRHIVSHHGEPDLVSFRSVNGINYTEVARRQKNGLSFNEYGYQIQPEWRIKFLSDDSLSIYSPTKKMFLTLPLTRGYDSIFNTARTWLKARHISKDSLVFELIKFKDGILDLNGQQIYMTFYSDNYIKNVLHTDTALLIRPTKQDTLFVSKLVARANADITKAFAARQPVILISKSPNVVVVKEKTEGNMLNHFNTSDDYMNPTFDVTIYKAYTDFGYSFTAYVDVKGKMTFKEPMMAFTEEQWKRDYIHLATSVMDSYLKYYLHVIPGSTLGMPHASVVTFNVKGTKAARPKLH